MVKSKSSIDFGGGGQRFELAEILNYLDPVEWEMFDFPNLVLETLDLDGQDLERVPAAVTEIEYYAFREVQAVSFNENARLREAAVLGKLDNLRAVNMWGCGLRQVPDTWRRLRKLCFLGLGNNPPLGGSGGLAAISAMTSLQWLDLGGCALTEVPPETHALTELVVLALGGNPGIRVGPALSRFTKLRRLALNDCALGEVPPAVYTLERLRRLHVDNNALRSLAQNVLRLRELSQLTCTGNRELVFPKMLNMLENIKEIVVDDDYQLAGMPITLKSKLRFYSQVTDEVA